MITAYPVITTHIWQSTLFAAATGLRTLPLKKNPARTRFWVWLTALVKFLVPFGMLVRLIVFRQLMKHGFPVDAERSETVPAPADCTDRAPGSRAPGSPWQKSHDFAKTGETACPTTKDRPFTNMVGQAFSPVGTSATG
jgi:hypothetical protein